MGIDKLIWMTESEILLDVCVDHYNTCIIVVSQQF